MKLYVAAAGLVSLALAGLALTVGGESADRLYPVPTQRVRQVLDRTDLPIMVFGHRAVTAKHWRADADTSMWAVLSSTDIELLRLSAKTVAEGEGTRVHVDVLPPESSLHDEVAEAFKQHAEHGNLYRSALAEQIDATLTNREFSMRNIAAAAALVTLSALPHVREAMDNAAAKFRKQDQDTIDRAYANEK